MHKDDAAKLFGVLSDGNRVKILKKLYNKGDMSYIVLQDMFEEDIKESLDLLKNVGFISLNNNEYHANKEFVDELMKFISTPCGCTK